MELIDRRKLVSDFWNGVEDGSILSYEDTDNLMENAPTVDAVEVVRCENCKFSVDEDGEGWLWCNSWANGTPRDGYCFEGERKKWLE